MKYEIGTYNSNQLTLPWGTAALKFVRYLHEYSTTTTRNNGKGSVLELNCHPSYVCILLWIWWTMRERRCGTRSNKKQMFGTMKLHFVCTYAIIIKAKLLVYYPKELYGIYRLFAFINEHFQWTIKLLLNS